MSESISSPIAVKGSGAAHTTVVVAALIGIASSIWSATFSDYDAWEAAFTGVGVFIFSLELAQEFTCTAG